MTGNVQPTFDLSSGNPIYAVWNELEITLPHAGHGTWETDQFTLPEDLEVTRSDVREEDQYYLCPAWSDPDQGPDPSWTGPPKEPDSWSLIHLSRGSRDVTVMTAARDPQQAKKLVDEAKEHFPISKPDPGEIKVKFWTLGNNGASAWNRELAAADWDEIKDNYPTETRKQLSELFSDDFSPGHGGQLILWHGPPGTGKTTAIRALVNQWSSWADLNYVTDPERFFGGTSSYMLSVLLHGNNEPYVTKEEEDADRGRWKLLVIEDAPELFGATAKQDVGPALGRFLNVVDGMIGQGLRVLVLATTNEDDGSWNKAVSRPGRTAAQIEFKTFDAEAAREWRVSHGLPNSGSAADLADLYAELNGARTKPSEKKVGFV